MIALVVALTIVAVVGWAKAMRAEDRLAVAHLDIAQLESRVLPEVTIYEQMRGLL